MSGSPLLPMAPIGVLLAPAFVIGLADLSLAELRDRRTQCALAESSVSYERQLIQGRLDIVRDEQARRTDDQVGRAVSGLVDRLPHILTLHAHSSGVGRPPTFMFPVHLDPDRQERMTRIAPVRALGDLPAQSIEELGTMSDRLEGMEHEISAQRRALHAVFDRIQQEVIRRYKSGEVPIESAFSLTPDNPPDGGQPTAQSGLEWGQAGTDVLSIAPIDLRTGNAANEFPALN
jgi:hypothetical protein